MIFEDSLRHHIILVPLYTLHLALDFIYYSCSIVESADRVLGTAGLASQQSLSGAFQRTP